MTSRLSIIIPFKAKSVSKNWSLTCSALNQTLNSIRRQTCQNFDAIVVGHDLPKHPVQFDEKIAFHSIETHAPDPSSKYLECEKDRVTKIARGVQLMVEKKNTHSYSLDGDDLLHNTFIETVFSKEIGAGCIIDGGFQIFQKFGKVVPSSELSQWCGSTSILSNDIFDPPNKLDDESIKSVPWCRMSHVHMDQFFMKEHDGNFYRCFEKILAYNRDYGDNLSDIGEFHWSRKFLWKWKHWAKIHLRGKQLNDQFREEFGLLS